MIMVKNIHISSLVSSPTLTGNEDRNNENPSEIIRWKTRTCGLRTANCGHANKKIPYVSAFSTLVENADTLENVKKMRKNARIRILSKTVA